MKLFGSPALKSSCLFVGYRDFGRIQKRIASVPQGAARRTSILSLLSWGFSALFLQTLTPTEARATTVCPEVTPDAVMDWAEATFPELFPRTNSQRLPSVTFSGVTYNARVYGVAAQARYLGVTLDGKVFALGDFTGGVLRQFETLSYWAPQVRQFQCPEVTITSQPLSATVQAGQQATFRVTAASNAQLRYRWYRNGVPIGETDAPVYTTPPLELSLDGSRYSVEILAGSGSTRSVEVNLAVTPGSQPWRRWLWANAGPSESNSVITWADGVRPNESAALILVNPDSPSNPVTVEGAGQASSVYFAGIEFDQLDYFRIGNGEGVSLSSRQGSFGYVVYAKGDRLWKVNLERSAAVPVPALLSSLSTRQICGSPAFTADPVKPIRSFVLVQSPPVGGSCNSSNLRRFLVPMDLGAQDPPIEATGSLLAALRWGDGSFRGFLIQRNRQILEVDHRFRVVSTLFSVSTDAPINLLHDKFAESGLLLFGEGNAVKLFRADRPGFASTIEGLTPSGTRVLGLHKAGVQRLLLVDSAGWLKSIRLDNASVETHLRDSRFFLAEAGLDASYIVLADSRRVIRFSANGSVTTLSDSTFAREGPVPLCASTPSSIVCRIVAGALAVVPKAGGSTLVTGFGQRDGVDVNRTWKVIDRSIWYQSLSTNNLEGGLRSVNDDGTGARRLPDVELGAIGDAGLAASDRASAAQQPDQWRTPYLQVISRTDGLQILDGRTGQVAVTYGALPRLPTATLVSMPPFYRAFDTGQPQLVPVVVFVGRDLRVELFMVRGNRPGLERVTRFVQ
jgi:hypothetical protein